MSDNVNLDSIDRLLVLEGKLTFKKDKLIESLVLNDDGIVEIYSNNKLVDKKPFSKSGVQKQYNDLIQEGYTIYTVSEDDYNVFSSHKYDTVDSQDQATDIVNELQAEGVNAYYEEDELSDKQESSDVLTQSDLDNEIENTKQAIQKVDELQDLKNELTDKMDSLVTESVDDEHSIWNDQLSYNDIKDMNLEDHLTNKQIQYIKSIFGSVDTLKQDMIDILSLFRFKDDKLLSISDYIQELKEQGGIL